MNKYLRSQIDKENYSTHPLFERYLAAAELRAMLPAGLI
jgi:hypothetical protein